METASHNHSIEDYIPFVYGLSFNLTHDPHKSEDLAQETLLNAFRHWDSLKNPMARKAWLRRICTNCFLMQLRKESGQHPLSLEEITVLGKEGDYLALTNPSPLPEEELIVSEAIKEMRDGCFLAMTRKLTLNQRMAFSMVDMFGMTIEEVSEILEISISATKALLHRSRTNIDNFFSQRCSLIDIHNPCNCQAYIDFQQETQERKQEIRMRIKAFRFPDKPEPDINRPLVRQKVLAIYRQMPQRTPDRTWFETTKNLFAEF